MQQQTIKDELEQLHQDAVIWKGKKIWAQATSPDMEAFCIGEIVTMLCCINNETKRNAYAAKLSSMVNDAIEEDEEEQKRVVKQKASCQKTVDRLTNKKKPTEEETTELDELKSELQELKKQVDNWESPFYAELNEKNMLKLIKDWLKQKKTKQEEQVRKANFEKTVRSAEDVGLPEDLSRDDVFDALKYGIYVHDNVYYSRGGKGGDVPITNFTMKIIYHIPTNDETSFRLIAVKNVWGFETVININTDDFVSVGSFKKILARRGDYIFKGGDADLCRLQEFLQKDETSAKRIETLGWNKANKFWAWANGLSTINEDGQHHFVPVDDHGIVEIGPKKFFIPAMSMMYVDKDGLYVNEKKFFYAKPIDGFGFEQWASLMFKAYGDKSIAAILFFIGALFRDVIMKKLRRYPILNLFGPPGAGKGELYDSLMQMFGQKQDQIMLGGASTVVGFMRKAAQFSNALFGLDEYKNNLPIKIIESTKNLYDGIGYERGKMTNDFTTESTPVNSSTILAGQDMPTIEPALFMRCILLAFEEGKFTEEQRSSFQLLKTKYEIHGLSYITADLLKFRNIFEKDYKERNEAIFKETIKDVANVEIDDRMMLNISMLLTTMDLTQKFIKFPFKYNEAKAWLIENMKVQHGILAGNNDVAKFWSVVEGLFYRNEIFIDRDFALEDGYIYIRLQQVHPMYQKEMIARRDMNYLGLATLRHYLSLDKSIYVDDVKKRFADGSNSWCYKMRYNKLGVDLIRLKQNAGETMSEFELKIKAKENEMATPKITVEQTALAMPEHGAVTDEQAEKAIDDLPF